MTPQERRLWSALRNRLLAGIKVRRQFPIDRFVLDFYIPSCRLGIEIDGDVHAVNLERDHERTALLNAGNIRIIRFTNDDVENDLPSVLDIIRTAAISKDLG
jgi:very-short-patch-repair endonuclease